MKEQVNQTNRLIKETSPYLLAHAHNPVDWLPWGEEAFEKARTEDKPVFLSIGYSTCHWCHVMAHECFEDDDVAQVLNAHFVCIKVDREERPDIDAVYMRACEAMTGNGGWPLSVFMGADAKPFYAGTYFPKFMFLRVLKALQEAWQGNRSSLQRNAARLTELIDIDTRDKEPRESAPIREAVEQYRSRFDAQYGGFGEAPKFPSPHNLMFLLHTAPDIAEKTLDCMYRGGIFDHVGGGFCRYSTDRFWLVPHFEKMLYDNALLAMTYAMAFEQTDKPLYRSVTRRVLQYIDRELRAPDGGYYSAQDADSEGAEGQFYLFTQDEIKATLGEYEGTRFCERYDIQPEGNFEGANIPNLIRSGDSSSDVDEWIPKIYDYRNRRVKPLTDNKKLTAWNALVAAAYAMAARIFKEDLYADIAKDTLAYIERVLTQDNAVFAGTAAGKRAGAGFLNDYACTIFALIQAYEATFEERFLARAKALTLETCRLFHDETNGGFLFSGEPNEKLIARTKETYDGAMPSGNSLMAYNLTRLSLLFDDEDLYETARKQAGFMNAQAVHYPMGYGFYLYSALPVKKIACATNDPKSLRLFGIRSDWAFRLVSDAKYPIVHGETTFYVCEDGVCRPPVHAL